MIQQTFQQYASLREEECVMKFFNTLAGFANIDQETYRCELIVTPPSFHSTPDPNLKPLRIAGHKGNSGWGWGSRQPSNLLLVDFVAPGPPPVYLKMQLTLSYLLAEGS